MGPIRDYPGTQPPWIEDDKIWIVSNQGEVLRNGQLEIADYGLRVAWSLGDDYAVAAGAGGRLVERDGDVWASVTTGIAADFADVWGADDAAVFAVGTGGTIWQREATSWTAATSPTSADLYAVWGWSATDAVAVGEGAVVRYDGATWTALPPPAAVTFTAAWGTSGDDLWVAGEGIYHFYGTTWTTQLPPQGLVRSLAGRSATDVLAAGDGSLWHYDGDRWSPLAPPRADEFYLGLGVTAERTLVVGASAYTLEQAFRRLGGAPATVVLDNLREGVLQPDIHDPLINPLYRDVLAHYGVVGLPCRVRDPDRKGKVEAGIAHTQKAVRGLRFETLDEAQAWLDHWDQRWADTRIHGTTKRQVGAAFADERPHLRPLPVEPFRYYAFAERTVHLDGFVEVGSAYYAPPPGWIGRAVRVQWDDQHVRLLDPTTGLLLREHLVADRGRHRMLVEDQPSRTPPAVVALIARAHGIGRAAGAIADAMYAENAVTGVRRIMGLCGLAKKRGASTVEAAAKIALEAGAPTYRFVKAYLDRHPATPLALRQIDPLIRELTQYRDLVCRITEGDPS